MTCQLEPVEDSKIIKGFFKVPLSLRTAAFPLQRFSLNVILKIPCTDNPKLWAGFRNGNTRQYGSVP